MYTVMTRSEPETGIGIVGFGRLEERAARELYSHRWNHVPYFTVE